VIVVLDASALVTALLGRSPNASALRRRLAVDVCHAPHLIDAEVGSVLRRRVLRSEIGPADAGALTRAGEALIDYRYQMTGPLATGAWAMYQNVSYYDALYVALAASLSVPLLTADDRLCRAPDLACVVERVDPT
jgi:predicted nucleic acid-binding protein